MWFGSSFACKWGLCANTCYVKEASAWSLFMLVLKRGPPSGGVRTLHLLEKYPSHSHPLPPTLLLVSCLQTNQPLSDFPRPLVPCFLPASLLLLWLCGSGYLAKDRVSAWQKGGRCFSHTSPTHLVGWENASAWRWRAHAHKQANELPVFLSSSCATVFGFQ